MRVTAPRGTNRDRKVFVHCGDASEAAVGQAGFRETRADDEIVENAILSQQR